MKYFSYFSQKIGFDLSCKLSPGDNLQERSKPIYWEKYHQSSNEPIVTCIIPSWLFVYLWNMYICIYWGPHGRLAITCICVGATCCNPQKIKSLLTYLLNLSSTNFVAWSWMTYLELCPYHCWKWLQQQAADAAPDKKCIQSDIFLISPCGYSIIEAPHHGTSNEYSKHVFVEKWEKYQYSFGWKSAYLKFCWADKLLTLVMLNKLRCHTHY